VPAMLWRVRAMPWRVRAKPWRVRAMPWRVRAKPWPGPPPLRAIWHRHARAPFHEAEWIFATGRQPFTGNIPQHSTEFTSPLMALGP